MFGRKYPEKITSQITAKICGTSLSNSIESHSETPSQGTPLDLSNSSLDLENSRLDLTQSQSHKATSAAKMQTSLNDAPSGWERSSVNPILTNGADYAHHITACQSRFENLTASLNLQSVRQSRSDLLCSPVVPGISLTMAPPDVGRSVNPISTKGDRLHPSNNTGTPGFSAVSMALLSDNSLGQESSNMISSNSDNDPEDKSTSAISLEGKLQKCCQILYKTLTRFDC